MKKFSALIALSVGLLIASVQGATAQPVPLPNDAAIGNNFQRLVEFEQYAREIGAYNISNQRRQARDNWEQFLLGNNFSPGQQVFLGTWDIPAPGTYQLPGSGNTRTFSPASYAFYPARNSDSRICILRFVPRGVSFAVADATPSGSSWRLMVSSPILSLPFRPEDRLPFTAAIIRYNLLLAEIFQSAGGDFTTSVPVSDPVALQEPEVFLGRLGVPDRDISRVRTAFNNSGCYQPEAAPAAPPTPRPTTTPTTGNTTLDAIDTGDITVRFTVASSRNAPRRLERDDQLLVVARIDNSSSQPIYASRFLSAQVNGQIQGGSRFGAGTVIPIGGSSCVPLLIPRQGLPDPLPRGRIFIYSFSLQDVDSNTIIDSRDLGLIRVAVSPQIPNWPSGMADFCPPPRR